MQRVGALAACALVASACSSDTDRTAYIYRVPSSSMEPTLHCARPQFGCEGKQMDRVAVESYDGRKPQRGDIVVFRTPSLARVKCGSGGKFIKRVVGLPGDRWSERAGFIVVNGRKLNEPYVPADRRDTLSLEGGSIAPGKYLLLGDNRRSSCDSRVWGLVPRENLIGRVVEVKRGSKVIHIR